MKTTESTFPPTALTAAAGPTPTEAERLQILTLVQQFEGMLLTEMLRDVRAGDDEEEDGSFGLGGSTMNGTMQTEFGMALSRAGGLGMADMLAAAFARRQAAVPPAVGDVHAHDDGVPTPLVSDSAARRSAAVTSDFGWRGDPLNGQRKFHNGMDVRMAYGTEVLAAARGVVASAGERPGYGLTVTVDHGDGRETRYAHLSAIDVSPGDPVGSGQLIARSGNSGRTTGAHLHFEAREFGRPVDPRLAAEAWTGRKTDTIVGESDDSMVRY